MGLAMSAMSLKVGERELTPKDSFLTIILTICWTLDSELGPKEPRSRCVEQDVLVCGQEFLGMWEGQGTPGCQARVRQVQPCIACKVKGVSNLLAQLTASNRS